MALQIVPQGLTPAKKPFLGQQQAAHAPSWPIFAPKPPLALHYPLRQRASLLEQRTQPAGEPQTQTLALSYGQQAQSGPPSAAALSRQSVMQKHTGSAQGVNLSATVHQPDAPLSGAKWISNRQQPLVTFSEAPREAARQRSIGSAQGLRLSGSRLHQADASQSQILSLSNRQRKNRALRSIYTPSEPPAVQQPSGNPQGPRLSATQTPALLLCYRQQASQALQTAGATSKQPTEQHPAQRQDILGPRLGPVVQTWLLPLLDKSMVELWGADEALRLFQWQRGPVVLKKWRQLAMRVRCREALAFEVADRWRKLAWRMQCRWVVSAAVHTQSGEMEEVTQITHAAPSSQVWCAMLASLLRLTCHLYSFMQRGQRDLLCQQRSVMCNTCACCKRSHGVIYTQLTLSLCTTTQHTEHTRLSAAAAEIMLSC